MPSLLGVSMVTMVSSAFLSRILAVSSCPRIAAFWAHKRAVSIRGIQKVLDNQTVGTKLGCGRAAGEALVSVALGKVEAGPGRAGLPSLARMKCGDVVLLTGQVQRCVLLCIQLVRFEADLEKLLGHGGGPLGCDWQDIGNESLERKHHRAGQLNRPHLWPKYWRLASSMTDHHPCLNEYQPHLQRSAELSVQGSQRAPGA